MAADTDPAPKLNLAKRFAFVFPMASGHINPSLPIARSLVEVGHEVHYLCAEQMREAVEDTGAIFHSILEEEPELYEKHEADLLGASESLKRAMGLRPGSVTDWYMVRNVMLELQLPGLLRFFGRLKPHAVVYCPLLNREAAVAASVLGVPAVALQTTAGPGSVKQFFEYTAEVEHTTVDEWDARLRSYGPNVEATERLNEHYGLQLEAGLLRPTGRLDGVAMACKVLMTTSEELKDPMPPDLARAIEEDGTQVIALGPLLDRPGAKRAGGHRTNSSGSEAEAKEEEPGCAVLSRVHAARAAGRPVVLVSMGTVITGDHPKFGWAGRERALDGRPCGLSGRELCQAAWAGAFDACSGGTEEQGPLVVVALGPQPDALEGVEVPPDAACAAVLPQVDILKAGVEAFLTHGGQNSFLEALALGAPVVVCPGAGDQVVNGHKAASLGAGLCVPRPEPPPGGEAAAAARYRAEVCEALRRVRSEPSFAQAAAACAARLKDAGGVARAVSEVLAAALPSAAAAAGGA